jgi:two-component system cell cycle response regulator DivK
MSRSILIIEDNEQNLYLMRFLLEKHGFKVFEAKNGPEGILRATALRPDAILIDIQLPLMDGYSVAAELRAKGDLGGTPIIAVTSYAMPGDRERALEAGATDYIEKPINPDTFADQIRVHLEAGGIHEV